MLRLLRLSDSGGRNWVMVSLQGHGCGFFLVRPTLLLSASNQRDVRHGMPPAARLLRERDAASGPRVDDAGPARMGRARPCAQIPLPSPLSPRACCCPRRFACLRLRKLLAAAHACKKGGCCAEQEAEEMARGARDPQKAPRRLACPACPCSLPSSDPCASSAERSAAGCGELQGGCARRARGEVAHATRAGLYPRFAIMSCRFCLCDVVVFV